MVRRTYQRVIGSDKRPLTFSSPQETLRKSGPNFGTLGPARRNALELCGRFPVMTKPRQSRCKTLAGALVVRRDFQRLLKTPSSVFVLSVEKLLPALFDQQPRI